ncbi:MAG: Lrp/AsnC ligand binding domain-containing protein [Thaumarchaeota archaeon]|nr:Lrp/AsnC ligand binding domain-containing protein [Nitrososphaerota archaeon]MDE1866769.1 Lrp/AsnC ligand binding domain-containing protein [Nitrososphaerota archaeon]
MTTAYVMIACDYGQEEQVLEELKSVDRVKEARGTEGHYDIVAEIESKTIDEINSTVSEKIRRIDGVRSTLILLAQC